MTWTLKHRPQPGSLIVADYECADHGKFESEVRREASGDPPAEAPCPHRVHPEHACGQPSAWRPSPPGAVRVKAGEFVRGKVAEYPGDEHVMDTRPLADGMPLHEFKARRAKVHRDISLRRVRKALGR